MSKKTSRPLKFAPLQRVTAEEITDPAELAAVDEMLRQRRERKQAMSKKTSRPLKFAPLQRVTAEEITDPAELAAVDEMLRQRRKRKQKARQATKGRKGANATSSSASKKRA